MPRATIVAVLALASRLFLSAGGAAAQTAPPADPAQVMILGVWHFENPGLDVVKTDAPDVMDADGQAQIEAIVDALARFRPTVVVVEARRPSSARLDSLYAAYRAGTHALSANEIQQLGFRLAARAGLERVHPADEDGEFPFQQVMEYAGAHEPAMAQWLGQTIAHITSEITRMHTELTFAEHLRASNDPALLAEGHGIYVRIASIGGGDSYVGADLLAKWYDRNIRIFTNVQRLARPGERVLVIFGSGHAPILRELARHDPTMRLVEPNDYLPVR